MEETKGLATAINTLGEKIAELETRVACERYLKEEAERTLLNRISELEKENDNLREKLNAVHMYIERMEEE